MIYEDNRNRPIYITVEEFLEQNPGIVDKIKFMTPEEVQEKVVDALWPPIYDIKGPSLLGPGGYVQKYSPKELVRFVKKYISGENIPAYNRLWHEIGIPIDDEGNWYG